MNQSAKPWTMAPASLPRRIDNPVGTLVERGTATVDDLRLMAAAPELLHAGEMALEVLESVFGPYGQWGGEIMVSPAEEQTMRELRDAISRAMGETE